MNKPMQFLMDYGFDRGIAEAVCMSVRLSDARDALRYAQGTILPLPIVKGLLGYAFCDKQGATWEDISLAIEQGKGREQ